MWTATIGHVSTGPHWPRVTGPGTTALLTAEAGPVPTALVADTVNV